MVLGLLSSATALRRRRLLKLRCTRTAPAAASAPKTVMRVAPPYADDVCVCAHACPPPQPLERERERVLMPRFRASMCCLTMYVSC